MQEYTLDCASLNLSPDEIFREMGYYKISPQKEISDLVSTLLKEVMEFTRPSYVFKIIEGEVYESWVALEKKTVLHVDSVIAKLLKGSERFAIFAATAGTDFQRFQDKFKQESNTLNS